MGWYMKNAKLRKCLFSKTFRQWEKHTFFKWNMKCFGEEQEYEQDMHVILLFS